MDVFSGYEEIGFSLYYFPLHIEPQFLLQRHDAIEQLSYASSAFSGIDVHDTRPVQSLGQRPHVPYLLLSHDLGVLRK